MGAVFCSYLIDTRLTRLRNTILEPNEKRLREIVTKHKDILDCECDRYGNTPLLFSIQNAKLESCKILLELGADANRPNHHTNITPMHLACTLKTLKSNPSVYNISTDTNPTKDDAAANLTKTDSSNSSSSSNSSNSKTQTAVAVATATASDNIITPTITNAETILEIISSLVKHGADMNKVISTDKLYIYGTNLTTTKLTPLMFAIEQRNIVAIDTLISLGVDINYQDSESHMCALHLACGIGNSSLIKKLLDSGGNPYLKSRGGYSTLHWLALNNKDEITSLLTILNHTNFLIDINLQNENGQTPLMLAAMKNKQNIVKVLLDNGGSLTVKDSKGQTAMDYANDSSCKNLMQSFKHVEKIQLKKLSKSKLSLNLSNSRNQINRSAISLTNVSRSFETLSVVDEDFTNKVIDEKKMNEEEIKNV